jgi:hypothetical protein
VLPQPAGMTRAVLPTASCGYLRGHLRSPQVNLRLRDSLQPAIDADVANALQVGQAYLSFLPQKISG